MLDLWLDTYQISRSFRKRGIVEVNCRDSNRRPNAACGAMHRQSAENPPGGAQGPFAPGLHSNGRADPARNTATRAGDPRVFQQRTGTTNSELAQRGWREPAIDFASDRESGLDGLSSQSWPD